ncbi:hypothetical protein ACFPVT_10415 [Corynebacterium choanae]|nr:hypothetical protein [Corynebacterium choanae]
MTFPATVVESFLQISPISNHHPVGKAHAKAVHTMLPTPCLQT